MHIAPLPGTGSLTLAGAALATGQVVPAADIAAGKLRFAPATAGTESFTFRVQDDGGTVNGGADIDAIARSMRVTASALPIADASGASLAAPAPPAAPVAAAVPASEAPPAAVKPAEAAKASQTSAGADPGYAEAATAASEKPLQLAAPVGNSRGPQTEMSSLVVSFGERRGGETGAQDTVLDAGLLGFSTRVAANNAQVEQFLTSMRAQGFMDELDRLREQARHEFSLEHTMALSATGVTFGLSVAYVFWMIRSGVLVGSLLSALPAWRVLDPLPVLSRADGNTDEDDDESGDDEAAAPDPGALDPMRTLRGY